MTNQEIADQCLRDYEDESPEGVAKLKAEIAELTSHNKWMQGRLRIIFAKLTEEGYPTASLMDNPQ
jgi:hypothetical protein